MPDILPDADLRSQAAAAAANGASGRYWRTLMMPPDTSNEFGDR